MVERRVLIVIAFVLAMSSGCVSVMSDRSSLDPDLALIVSEEEKREYDELESSGQEVWLRRYWIRADPTPTTETNERRDEHRRRVSVARSRFGSGKSPGWDCRGEIYVRFGEPDYRLIAPGTVEPGKGLVPPEETWTYVRDGLVFRFEDRTLNGEFTFAFDPRDEKRARYQPWDDSTPEDVPRGFEAMDVIDWAYTEAQLAQMETDGLKAIEFTPSAYHHNYGANEIAAWMEIAAFSDGMGGYKVEVNRELDRAVIADAFQFEEELYITNRVAVFDSSYNLSELRAEEKWFAPGGPSPAVFSDTIHVGAGEFWIAASARVSSPPLIAIFDDEIHLVRRSADDFWVSDLAVKTHMFTDDGRTLLAPRPSRFFEEEEAVVLVFEIYGIGEGGRYEVEYSLSPIMGEASLLERVFGLEETIPEVLVSYSGHSRTGTVREEVILDTSDLEHDNYRLVVSATNSGTGEVKSREVTLRFQD